MPQVGRWQLTPAYDLLAVRLAMPSDKEELALTLNGKKSNLKRADFLAAMEKSDVSAVVVDRMIEKFVKLLPKWEECIRQSFLPNEHQTQYINYISQMMTRITTKTE